MRLKRQRFPVGLEFIQNIPFNGGNTLRTIIDVLTTTNTAGEVVKIEYVTSHLFCGQVVKGRMSDTSIAHYLSPEELAKYK